MLPKIQAKIEEDSLLKKGTWAYLGDAKDKSKRYLFWTSVDISSDSGWCRKEDTGYYQYSRWKVLYFRNNYRYSKECSW